MPFAEYSFDIGDPSYTPTKADIDRLIIAAKEAWPSGPITLLPSSNMPPDLIEYAKSIGFTIFQGKPNNDSVNN